MEVCGFSLAPQPRGVELVFELPNFELVGIHFRRVQSAESDRAREAEGLGRLRRECAGAWGLGDPNGRSRRRDPVARKLPSDSPVSRGSRPAASVSEAVCGCVGVNDFHGSKFRTFAFKSR